MINKTLNPISTTSPHMDAEWLAATAEKVLSAMEERRSTWQSWHVRAEAQRHVRAAQLPTDRVEQLVELIVAEVLQTRSVALAWTDDNITEPAVLRRADGSSVYTVAGLSCSPPPGSWPPSSVSLRPQAAPTDGLWRPKRSSWRCWKHPPTGMP